MAHRETHNQRDGGRAQLPRPPGFSRASKLTALGLALTGGIVTSLSRCDPVESPRRDTAESRAVSSQLQQPAVLSLPQMRAWSAYIGGIHESLDLFSKQVSEWNRHLVERVFGNSASELSPSPEEMRIVIERVLESLQHPEFAKLTPEVRQLQSVLGPFADRLTADAKDVGELNRLIENQLHSVMGQVSLTRDSITALQTGIERCLATWTALSPIQERLARLSLRLSDILSDDALESQARFLERINGRDPALVLLAPYAQETISLIEQSTGAVKAVFETSEETRHAEVLKSVTESCRALAQLLDEPRWHALMRSLNAPLPASPLTIEDPAWKRAVLEQLRSGALTAEVQIGDMLRAVGIVQNETGEIGVTFSELPAPPGPREKLARITDVVKTFALSLDPRRAEFFSISDKTALEKLQTELATLLPAAQKIALEFGARYPGTGVSESASRQLMLSLAAQRAAGISTAGFETAETPSERALALEIIQALRSPTISPELAPVRGVDLLRSPLLDPLRTRIELPRAEVYRMPVIRGR